MQKIKPTRKPKASLVEELKMRVLLLKLERIRTSLHPGPRSRRSKTRTLAVAARRSASEDTAHFLGVWRRSCKDIRMTADLSLNVNQPEIRALLASLRDDIMPGVEALCFASHPQQFQRLMELWSYHLSTHRPLFESHVRIAVVSPLATTYLARSGDTAAPHNDLKDGAFGFVVPGKREDGCDGLRLTEVGVEVPVTGGQALVFDARHLRHHSAPVVSGNPADRHIVVGFVCRNTIPERLFGKKVRNEFFRDLGRPILLSASSKAAGIIYSQKLTAADMKARILALWEKGNL
ncbi:hypothetical protein RQP46_005768 [Phenoliferia psychrophenolica]